MNSQSNSGLEHIRALATYLARSRIAPQYALTQRCGDGTCKVGDNFELEPQWLTALETLFCIAPLPANTWSHPSSVLFVLERIGNLRPCSCLKPLLRCQYFTQECSHPSQSSKTTNKRLLQENLQSKEAQDYPDSRCKSTTSAHGSYLVLDME